MTMKEPIIRRIIDSAFIQFKNTDLNNYKDFKVSTYPHYQSFKSCNQMLRHRGFEIGINPRINEHYSILNPMHKYGRKGDLEVQMDIYPTGIKYEFYQNVVFENKCGGFYDFNKYDRMPYLIKKSFLLESMHIIDFYKKRGVKFKEDGRPKDSVEVILKHFQDRSFDRNTITSLDQIPSYMSDYDFNHNSKDRDDILIECGQIKYFRDRITGRLSRGQVWHNINNMWWVICDRFTLRNIGSYELFTPTLLDYCIRRSKKGKIPKANIDRINALKSVSSGALKRELKRRAA